MIFLYSNAIYDCFFSVQKTLFPYLLHSFLQVEYIFFYCHFHISPSIPIIINNSIPSKLIIALQIMIVFLFQIIYNFYFKRRPVRNLNKLYKSFSFDFLIHHEVIIPLVARPLHLSSLRHLIYLIIS